MRAKALRSSAVEVLGYPSQIDDPRSRELAEEFVAADDPAMALLGLSIAAPYTQRNLGVSVSKIRIRSIAAVLAALRHPNKIVCRTARDRWQNAREEDAREEAAIFSESAEQAGGGFF